jgi:hypothetical protein
LTNSDFKVDGMARAFSYMPIEGDLEGWTIRGTFDVVDARLVITKMSIVSDGAGIPENGITGTLLRNVRPAFLLDRVRAAERGWLGWLERQKAEGHDIPVVNRSIDEARDLVTAPRSGPSTVRGRPPLSANFLREVSAAHREEVETMGNYGAIPRLARRYNAPISTAKSWIEKARDRGLYQPRNASE